jgi:hypothetical protein
MQVPSFGFNLISKIKATKICSIKYTNNTKSWDIHLEEMMEAGVHFGHQARKWNPKMTSYISCKFSLKANRLDPY